MKERPDVRRGKLRLRERRKRRWRHWTWRLVVRYGVEYELAKRAAAEILRIQIWRERFDKLQLRDHRANRFRRLFWRDMKRQTLTFGTANLAEVRRLAAGELKRIIRTVKRMPK